MSQQSNTALPVARAILADPRKRYTVSTLQILDICRALDLADREPDPVITTDLAEATRAFIAAYRHHQEMGLLNDAALVAELQAFRTFSTLFEQEFPVA